MVLRTRRSIRSSAVVKIAAIVLAGSAWAPAWQPNNAIESLEAKQLWEKLVEAKGGRERLHGVRTMLQTEHSHLSFPNPRFKNGDDYEVRLYAFPDRVWQYYDARPTVFAFRYWSII
jgi:hypothetical protein